MGRVIAAAVLVLAPSALWAQNMPSQNFTTNLPSYGINRTLEGGYSTADRFLGKQSPTGGSFVSPFSLEINLMRDTQAAPNWGALSPGPGLGPLVNLKFRTIDSLNFDKRARFAKLRETTLALAERVRQMDQASVGQVNIGFRQFMFPLPLTDQPQPGYGFFSQVDLVGNGGADPEAFLAPFTQEVQQSLGEKKFLEAVQAMLFNRAMPEGLAIDQFYDTQLAALANFLFSNGRFAAAAQAWGILAGRDPSSAVASRGLAISLLGSGQMKKAAVEIRRSLALVRGWPAKVRIVGSNLADVFPNAQDVVGIREELLAQLAKQPDDADLNLVAAYLDLFQGRLAEAQTLLDKLAATDETARGLAEIVKAGRITASVKQPAPSAFRQAVADVTGLEEPPLSPEARDRLVVVLQTGAKSYEDYMRLGDFRFFMGDYTQASEAYRAAHKAKPQDPFALFAMGHASFANGEYKLAAGYLRSAMSLETNWGLYDFHLQEFYGNAAEYRQQVKELERKVQLRPQSMDAKFLLAYVYYFSGRYSDAADLLTEIAKQDPKFEQANTLLRLARLQG
jgi:tetratricopeptide (TPR) repeat protein